MSIKPWSACLLIPLLFAACLKEELDLTDIALDVNPEFGVPIANASIRADRLIDHFDDNGLISTASNGALSLIYTDTVLSLNIDELLALPDQSFNDEIALTPFQISELVTTGSVTIIQDSWWSFASPQGDRVDSLRFESGLFSLDIQSPNSFPVSGLVRIFSADNTESFSFDFEDATAPVDISTQSDFQNVLLQFVNDDEYTNGLRVQYEVTFQFAPGIIGGPLSFALGISDFKVASVGGYIAPRTLPIDGLDAKLVFFDGYEGSVVIADPKFRFYCSNGFGIGLGIAITELNGIDAQQGVLTYGASDLPTFPSIAPALSPELPVETILSLSNSNINPSLTDFFAFRPSYVQAGFELTVNPDNDESQFATLRNGFDVTFETEVPLYGSVGDFHLEDTAEVDLADLVKFADDTAELEELEVRLDISNGFPIDVAAQIILVDANFNPIDSLFLDDQVVFQSAPLNTTVDPGHPDYGRATGTTDKRTLLSVSSERALALDQVTHIIIRVKGATTNNGAQLVRFFSNDRFDVAIAGKVKLNFP